MTILRIPSAQPEKISYWKVTKKTTNDFATVTAISGLVNSANSKSLLGKFIWMALFIIGTVVTTIDVTNVIQSYLSYPFTTQKNVVHSASIEFPEVTVCNQNRVNCKKALIVSLKYSGNNDVKFKKFFDIYILTKCGAEGLGCDTVRDVYYVFRQKGTPTPQEAYDQDWCLSCDELWKSYISACKDNTKSISYKTKYISKLNDTWVDRNCSSDSRFTYETLSRESCTNATATAPKSSPTRKKRALGTQPLLGGLGSVVSSLGNTVGGVVSAVGDTVGGLLGSSGGSTLGNTLTNTTSGLTNTLNNATSGLTNTLSNATSGLTDTLSNATSGLTNTLSNATSGLTNLTTGLIDTLSNVTTDLTNTLSNVTNGLTNTLTNLTTGLTDVLTNVTTGLNNTLTNTTTGVVDTATNVTKPINNTTTTLVEQTINDNYEDLLKDIDDLTQDKPPEEDYTNASRVYVPSESYNLQMEFMIHYMSLSIEERQEIGYDLDEFIIDCTFMEYKCDMKRDFNSVYSAIFGNCYTYHQDEEMKTSLTSSLYGLTMVMNIAQDTYMPRLLTTKAGVRMSVHRHLVRPQLEDNAIDLDVGKSSSIAMQKIYLTRLPDPFEAQCSSSWNETKLKLSSDTDGSSDDSVYTISECLRMCLQHLFIDACNCAHPLYPEDFVYEDKRYLGYNLCNLTEGDLNYLCVKNSLHEFALDPSKYGCDCNIECEEIAYAVSLTSATWPPIVSTDTVEATYNNTDIKNNLLRVEIYYKSLNVDSVKQLPVYQSTSDFVSSLGGALGLYLGISIILIGEVLEYLILLAWNIGLNCCKRYKEEEESDDEDDKK